MNKIVIFGDLPIATKVAIWANSQPSIELVGVVSGSSSPHNNDPWKDVPLLFDYAHSEGIPIMSLSELNGHYQKGSLDLGLLCRFGKIIKAETIGIFRKGIINMHGGLLPECAGLYSCNHAILQGCKTAGGTLHYVDEGIDTGDILRRCEFAIEDEDTAYSVFQKTQIALYNNMIELVPEVLSGEAEATPISHFIDNGFPHHYFGRKSLEGEKRVNFATMQEDEILRRVRAFDFPGYEPAYAIVKGRKLYLRTGANDYK